MKKDKIFEWNRQGLKIEFCKYLILDNLETFLKVKSKILEASAKARSLQSQILPLFAENNPFFEFLSFEIFKVKRRKIKINADVKVMSHDFLDPAVQRTGRTVCERYETDF